MRTFYLFAALALATGCTSAPSGGGGGGDGGGPYRIMGNTPTEIEDSLRLACPDSSDEEIALRLAVLGDLRESEVPRWEALEQADSECGDSDYSTGGMEACAACNAALVEAAYR